MAKEQGKYSSIVSIIGIVVLPQDPNLDAGPIVLGTVWTQNDRDSVPKNL